MKLKFDGGTYGSSGFSIEDGPTVCFSFYEIGLHLNEIASYGNPRIKQYLYDRDDRVCKYCKRYVSYKEATIDHYYPAEFWHIDDRELYDKMTNLVIACHRCNFIKGKKSPEGLKIHDIHDKRLRTRIIKFIKKKVTHTKLFLNGTRSWDGKHVGIEKYRNMNKKQREEALDARFKKSY